MNEGNRIYGKQVNLKAGEDIRDFFDKRAENYMKGKKNRYTTVLLGDENPEYAGMWNQYEMNFILPYLKVGNEHRVLDIGCGVGRWAETVLSTCGTYVGVDFSGEMVRAAREHFVDAQNAIFIQSSFQDIFLNEAVVNMEERFDTVIIAGVSMYIDDNELKECFYQLGNILNKEAVVYIEESVGVTERLTLDGIWSENLGDSYHAIYRTKDEYMSLLQPLLKKSEKIKTGYFENLDKKNLAETSHLYILLRNKD